MNEEEPFLVSRSRSPQLAIPDSSDLLDPSQNFPSLLGSDATRLLSTHPPKDETIDVSLPPASPHLDFSELSSFTVSEDSSPEGLVTAGGTTIQSPLGSSTVTSSTPPKPPSVVSVSDLPVELLREIFRFTPATDHRSVIALGAVTSFWRSIALTVPSLYTHAKWDRWSVDVLEEWARRGAPAGLDVALGRQAIRRALYDLDMDHLSQQQQHPPASGPDAGMPFLDNSDSDLPIRPLDPPTPTYVQLLDRTSLSWRSLSMEFDRGEDDTAVHDLFARWECPNLRSLCLVDLDTEGQYDALSAHPNLAPQLAELVCRDVHIVRSTPWTALQHVVINVDFWSRGAARKRIFDTIAWTEALTLDGCGFTGLGGSNISLEGVRQVTIVDDSVSGFAEWPLRHISFPRVSRLTLRGLRPFPNEFPELDRQLWVSPLIAHSLLNLHQARNWFVSSPCLRPFSNSIEQCFPVRS